ncbi:MAG TPA: TlpA disulfide reductase family protein [Candidatus Dormibacteraeota bacterium]|jgi:peroxiredoxin|nr:TlpA disulfide reductase family protein [Candidatus Dormibacteraeota bacterium]
MLRKLTPLQVLALVALVLFTVFITWRAKKIERALADHDSAATMRGKSAPDFSLDSLEGHKVSMAEFRGKKKVVISYWASWCGPCRVELPELKQFYEKYHKEDSDFEVLAISIDDDRESAEAYATKAKLPFPVLLDLGHDTAEAYSVEAIPTMFIVEKDGKVKSASTGVDQSMEIKLALELGLKPENIFQPPNGTTPDDNSH